MDPALLADLILVAHFAYVAFVIGGLALVVLGGLTGWTWVRRPGWRWTHLVCTLLVPLESLVGVLCPLTDWENRLRERAGAGHDEMSFVARWLSRILFYDVSESVLTTCYLVFAALVVGAFFWVRPGRGIPRRS
jgi:hypothetical protein